MKWWFWVIIFAATMALAIGSRWLLHNWGVPDWMM